MERRSSYGDELWSYLIGFGLAVVLSALPFGCVAWAEMPRASLLWLIAVAAAVQVVVHLRFFLHINLNRSKREDLMLILFTALIAALMTGGTIWILANQHERMMM